MDLDAYKPSLLIACAIEAEMTSRDVYREQSERTSNGFLADKLILLSREEEKHRLLLVRLFERLFPGQPLVIPEENPIPMLAFIDESEKDMGGNSEKDAGKAAPSERRVFEVLEVAMNSELAARDYYLSMRSLFMDDSTTAKSLEYLASMELGHYRILEHELDNQRIGGEFDTIMKSM